MVSVSESRQTVGLKANAVNLWGDFVVSIANVARRAASPSRSPCLSVTPAPPGFLGRALPLAVLIAVLGTSQIQMVEPSRVLYAMARDRLIPAFFGGGLLCHL